MSRHLDKTISLLLLSLIFVGPILVSLWGYDYAILAKESLLILASGSLFILLFLRVAAERDFSLRATPLGKPVLALLGFAVLSISRAVNLPAALYRLTILLAGASLFYVAMHARLDRERIEAFARAAVASALIATLYAFLQYARLDPFRLVVLSSTLGNPNFLGEYLSMTIPISLALALSSGRAWKKQVYGLSALFLFAGLLLSRARGATFAFLASLGLFALLLRWQGMGHPKGEARRLLPVVGLALVIAGFFGFHFLSDFAGPGGVKGVLERYARSGGIQQNLRYRPVFYLDSLSMALDNPLFGVGIGNFEFAYPRYRSMPETLDPNDLVLDHAHNDYLELWAELGLGGIIALIWLLWAFFRKMLHPQESSMLASGYAASVGAIAVNSLFAFGLYNPMPFTGFWLSMAFALRLRGRVLMGEAEGAGAIAGRRPPLWAILLAVPAVSALLYVSVRPLVADAYLSQGHKLLARGRVNQAIPRLEQAARLAPARQEAQGYLAQAYFVAMQYSEAVAVLDRYLRQDPYNFRVLYLLGLNLEQSGDDEEALKAYERARRIYPLYSKPLLRIGMIRERRRDLEGALGAYREAVRLNPTFAEASNNLAVLLAAQGKLDEAIQIWEEGAKRSPGDLIIAQNLAAAYGKKGDRERAFSWAARAEQLRVKGKR